MIFDTRHDQEKELWKYCQLEYKKDPEYAFSSFLEERKSKGGKMRKILKSIASIF